MEGGSSDSAVKYEDTDTTIFVGGLGYETQTDAVERYYQQFGKIKEAVVIMDKQTGVSKGYGYVMFEDAVAAQKARSDLSPDIDGRRGNYIFPSAHVVHGLMAPSTPANKSPLYHPGSTSNEPLVPPTGFPVYNNQSGYQNTASTPPPITGSPDYNKHPPPAPANKSPLSDPANRPGSNVPATYLAPPTGSPGYNNQSGYQNTASAPPPMTGFPDYNKHPPSAPANKPPQYTSNEPTTYLVPRTGLPAYNNQSGYRNTASTPLPSTRFPDYNNQSRNQSSYSTPPMGFPANNNQPGNQNSHLAPPTEFPDYNHQLRNQNNYSAPPNDFHAYNQSGNQNSNLAPLHFNK